MEVTIQCFVQSYILGTVKYQFVISINHLYSSALYINPLNAELNPICHLLALLGGATIVVVSRLRVNLFRKRQLPSRI